MRKIRVDGVCEIFGGVVFERLTEWANESSIDNPKVIASRVALQLIEERNKLKNKIFRMQTALKSVTFFPCEATPHGRRALRKLSECDIPCPNSDGGKCRTCHGLAGLGITKKQHEKKGW